MGRIEAVAQRILELYDKGLTQAQIALRLGVSSMGVHRTLKQAGRKTVGRGGRGSHGYSGPVIGGGARRVHPHFIEHGNGQQEY